MISNTHIEHIKPLYRAFILILLAACSAPTAPPAPPKPTPAPPPSPATKPQARTEPLQRFVILDSPGPAWIPGKPIWEQPLDAHGDYMHHLYLQGKLVMAGPFTDSTGGLVIIDVADQTEAQQIIDNDPAILAHVFNAEIHPWYSVDWKTFGSSPQ